MGTGDKANNVFISGKDRKLPEARQELDQWRTICSAKEKTWDNYLDYISSGVSAKFTIFQLSNSTDE